MKKLLQSVLTIGLSVLMCVQTFALTDTYIFTDPVTNTYVGQTEATDMIKNLNFTDTASSPYSESIARMGAFDIVKGYNNTFKPNSNVSNQEAIAFIIRALGRERQAQQNAITLAATNQDSSITTLWSLGYLQEAFNLNMITLAEYQTALSPDQSVLTEESFRREAVAKREDIAMWIYKAENTISPNEFPIKADLQKVYTYSDWKSITPDKMQFVETVTANGIMNENTKTFNPKGPVSRGEMTEILSNLDSIYFTQNNLAKKTGTVGGVKNSVAKSTGQQVSFDLYYVRDQLGKIDVIQKEYNNGTISPQYQNKDVPVYKNGKVYGLDVLKEGDQIEYIVETASNKNPNELTCYYIEVVSPKLTTSTVFGKLESVNPTDTTVTLRDYKTNQLKTYFTAQGIFGTDDNNNPYMIMNQNKYQVSKLPYGSGVNVTLKNDIISEILYHGEPTIITEERGVVIENNPEFGYMVIYDKNNKKKTYNYDEDSLITVKKLEHYQSEDSVGYIDQVFKNGNYNPVNSTIDKIEPGDIVFIRPSKEDNTFIESISASPVYNTKYGKILSFVDNGDTTNMLVSFDNGLQSMYTFSSDIIIMKEGQVVNNSEVQVGDYAKFLVNTAVIAPGYVIETVKEIALEGNASYITQIVKGQVAGVDNVQKTIQVQNAMNLEKSGWKNYKQVNTYNLKDKNIEIFYKGKRTDLDFVTRYLKRGNNEVYIAMENNYSGEKVKRITIYDGRDTFMPADTVVSSSPSGDFVMANNFQTIDTDDGTIVVRNGRLVTPNNISPYDYATVSLNGQNHAAVVSIDKKADTSGIMLSRGRVQSVNDGQSFTVSSMVTLTNTDWVITPIARTFNIDNSTVFMDDTGAVQSIDNFLDYTADSVYGDVFNIVSDGTTAKYVIQAPYTKEKVRGTVYKVDGDNVYIKDAMYLDLTNNTWNVISRKDNTAIAATKPNTIILKDNAVSKVSKIGVGDSITFYSTKMDYKKVSSGMSIDAYIVEVTK